MIIFNNDVCFSEVYGIVKSYFYQNDLLLLNIFSIKKLNGKIIIKEREDFKKLKRMCWLDFIMWLGEKTNSNSIVESGETEESNLIGFELRFETRKIGWNIFPNKEWINNLLNDEVRI